ncbi:hypothetical protein [Ureibacillus manganicus]|nr:hypothetical protein [Ureibacillus manganicus]
MYFFQQPHPHNFFYQNPANHIVQAPITVNPHLLYQTAQRSQLPPVDTTLLHESAKETQKLMSDANKVVEMFSTSKDFSTKVMDAAQHSNREEVKRLIRSNGVTSQIEVYFNPDGIRLEFRSKCCQLLVVLRWR